MPKATVIQTSFNAGQFSEALDGHINAPRRQNAVKELTNLIPIKQGPAVRRGGTRFVGPTKLSGKVVLVPFEFSVTQAYMIEFGDLYCRFWKNRAPILETATLIEGATAANPVVITSTAHGYSDGDEIIITVVEGMTELNGKRFIVANKNTNDYELQGIDGTGFTAYVGNGEVGRVYEIVSPFSLVQLLDLDEVVTIDYTQSADVLYFVHGELAPRTLSRTADTTWTFATLEFTDGPYLNKNLIKAQKVNPSGVSGTITLTATSALFVSTDVGRLFRQKQSGDWGYCEITVFTSTTLVTAEILGDNWSASANNKNWRFGLYSETTGYPKSVTFFQDRLCFAGSDEAPQRVDMSESGAFSDLNVDFAPTAFTDGTVNDDNAVAFTMSSDKANVIRFIRSVEKGLAVGTSGGEWIVKASSVGEAITPDNVNATKQDSSGVSNIRPVSAANALLFIQRYRQKLQEFAFVFEDDQFNAADLTVLANTIAVGGVVDMAYQQEPHGIIWMPRVDGKLLGFTYEPEQDVLAWHVHDIGGFSNSAKTVGAIVERVAVIPSPDTSRHDLWMVVQRNVDMAEVRYIEYMERTYDDDQPQEDAFCVDSGLTYEGPPTTTLRNLGHLEGETVEILADGSAHAPKTVSGGQITTDISVEKAQVGLPYTWRLRPFDPEAGAADGTAQGKLKRITRVTLRVRNTLDLEYGDSSDNLFTHDFNYGLEQGVMEPLFSGDVQLDWPGDYDSLVPMIFQGNGAMPVEIQALIRKVNTQDR